MIVLGVDPSSVATGWGVLDGNSRSARSLAHGAIRPPPNLSFAERLRYLHKELAAVLESYDPESFVIESTFLHRNVRTALVLGQVRGVLLLAAAFHEVPVFEYSASEIKRAAVGNGSADKSQVANMMARILGLAAMPTHDETDALAAAWCHLVRSSVPRAMRGVA